MTIGSLLSSFSFDPSPENEAAFLAYLQREALNLGFTREEVEKAIFSSVAKPKPVVEEMEPLPFIDQPILNSEMTDEGDDGPLPSPDWGRLWDND